MNGDGALLSVGAPAEGHNAAEVVDDQRSLFVGQPGSLVQSGRDIPGVKGVLVEPHADIVVEAQAHGPQVKDQPRPLALVHCLDRLGHGLVGDQGVVGLGPGRLGVPLVPHGRVEVVRRGGPGPDVLQAPLEDDRTRAQMREHLGDRPLVAIRGRRHLRVIQPTGERVQAFD